MLPEKQIEKFEEITGYSYEERFLGQPGFDAYPAMVADRERTSMQAIEVITITTAADAIEQLLLEKGFNRPTVYSILTAGMNVPEGATKLGEYCKPGSAFASFMPTDIEGHSGDVHALKKENGETVLFFKGRPHPYELDQDPYGHMKMAHMFQVMKELARRQRADGIDPVFIFTYLTGVREGSAMKPGDLAAIIDDTPADNDTHPGHGPRKILDLFTGDRFQAKDSRSSTLELVKMFTEFVRARKKKMFSAAVIGTPGTTEYQSKMEVGLFDAAYEQAMKNDSFRNIVEKTEDTEDLAVLFGMGVTAELAAMRQTFHGNTEKRYADEEHFKVLALGLATDAVGGVQSTEISHQEVVRAAFAEGEPYRDLILEFINSEEFNEYIAPKKLMHDHSIQAKFSA